MAWNYVKLQVEVKTTKNIMVAQVSVMQAKTGPKIRFFAIFWSLVHQLFCKLNRMIAWNIV